MLPRASPADAHAASDLRRHAAAVHTFQRSLGNGTDSAVAMVRRSVLVHTDTGMVDPSDVCSRSGRGAVAQAANPLPGRGVMSRGGTECTGSQPHDRAKHPPFNIFARFVIAGSHGPIPL